MIQTSALLSDLRRPVGPAYLLPAPEHTARYRTGFRSAHGEALALAFPASPLESLPVLPSRG